MAERQSKIKIKWSKKFSYVIGIIATDGNLSSDMRHICITSKDLEMVTNCKKFLLINNKIGKKARGGSKDKKYYTLQFGDKNFFDFLITIGLTPRKSKTIEKIKIPKIYFKDFLRGCIDGDGSITTFNHPESKQPQYKLRLCSASENFLKWILNECANHFSITGGSIHIPKKSSVYTLVFGKKDCITILNYIYKNQTISLSRKQEVANKILQYIK